MPPKRKIRNLPRVNDKEKVNQMSFFEPVYQNDNIQMNDDDDDDDDDDESDSELSVNDISQKKLQDKNKHESNETFDQDPSSDISTSKIVARIKQIQNSIEQAKTMLQSMEKFKHLVPGSQEQCEKLYVIIENLEEQQSGYVNLLNLITLTNKEKATLIEKISATHRSIPTNTNNQSNDDIDDEVDDNDEDEDEDEDDDLSSRRNVRSPLRPRIESKIGFTPQSIIPPTPTVPPTINSSDNEQNNRNDNSNYDSLVGSLKSDTINWKDQQLTSGDEASDVESEKEIQRNLMLQKEQLRALQGQKRALLALKKRSEQRLIEQQQLVNKKTTDRKENLSENDLLSDINNLRDRLKLLRNLYEQRHQVEVQEIKNSSKKQPTSSENRVKNLEHVREQLNELEQIVTYYQLDLMNKQDEETTVYEETSIQPEDAQRLKKLLIQERQKPISTTSNNNENTPKQLDKLSSELAAKRLELEEAKSALNRLQQMVKKIEPDQCSSSTCSTPKQSSSTKPINNNNNNNYEFNTNQFQYTPTSSQKIQTTNTNVKTSLLSSILSPKSIEQQKPITTRNSYADAKMAAQHREIERLVESRQRLHTIKDQIVSLHQSMTTSPIQSKKDSTNEIQQSNQFKTNINEPNKQTNTYEDKLTNSKNLRSLYTSNNQEEDNNNNDDDDDDDSELYQFEGESGDGEEINDDDDDDDTDEAIQSRIKQGNFHAPEDIVAEHEQNILNKKIDSTDELSIQMREICRCLSTFIQEQKSFNQHIEEHLKVITNNSSNSLSLSNINDPIFNQLQQQVLTQGLIVNLNTAYREIATLQSEINTLQSENNRLSSSSSTHDNQFNYKSHLYSRDNSKDSIYSLDQIKPIHSRFDEHIQQNNRILTTNNKFENSSKTSFNSQSTGQQTAIHLTENNMERTPVKHERNVFSGKRISPSKPIHLRSKPLSNEYEISSNHHHHHNSTKENLSKSFIIHRRPISNDNENNFLKSQLFNYDQKLQQNTFDDDDYSENEQQKNNLSTIQPSTYYTTATTIHNFDNIDMQKLHDQIKIVMGQLIPFMRLHVNDICNQSILNHIRDRIIFSFKQQPDTAQLIRNFQNQFSESLEKTIEKYCGTIIRECANDLMRDISDITFNELIKYKIYQNTNNVQTTDVNEQITQPLNKQQDDYTNLYESSVRHYTQQTSAVDDGENDNKYQIELSESEDRPLTLIGSDEEDNDSDQEENKDSELETAVSRQEINLNQNEIPSSTELNSNGHEYIVVHHSIHDQNPIVDNTVPNDEEKTNENQNVVES